MALCLANFALLPLKMKDMLANLPQSFYLVLRLRKRETTTLGRGSAGIEPAPPGLKNGILPTKLQPQKNIHF